MSSIYALNVMLVPADVVMHVSPVIGIGCRICVQHPGIGYPSRRICRCLPLPPIVSNTLFPVCVAMNATDGHPVNAALKQFSEDRCVAS